MYVLRWFQSSEARRGCRDPSRTTLRGWWARFNPLKRGGGVVTAAALAQQASKETRFNPLKRGGGVVTSSAFSCWTR